MKQPHINVQFNLDELGQEGLNKLFEIAATSGDPKLQELADKYYNLIREILEKHGEEITKLLEVFVKLGEIGLKGLPIK